MNKAANEEVNSIYYYCKQQLDIGRKKNSTKIDIESKNSRIEYCRKMLEIKVCDNNLFERIFGVMKLPSRWYEDRDNSYWKFFSSFWNNFFRAHKNIKNNPVHTRK